MTHGNRPPPTEGDMEGGTQGLLTKPGGERYIRRHGNGVGGDVDGDGGCGSGSRGGRGSPVGHKVPRVAD